MPAELSARDVADYFLRLVEPDCGDCLTNLRLQKLLYYAQGLNLAIHGTPLFPEEIRAWAHGPSVPEVYHAFKQYGADAIPLPFKLDFDKFGGEAREVLNEVWNVFGQFSASRLRAMTHEEPPWRRTAIGDVIQHGLMADYFKTQLIEGWSGF